MNAEAWVALAFGTTGLLLNLVLLGVAFGVLRGTVMALHGRVTALEGEMSALNELKVKVAEIRTRQDIWIEQLKELNASIRWMRDPAGHKAAGAPPQGRGR
jgi:hypothetical protein